ncbi:MAG: Rrf2 family transcriptional regulator [Gemmatimonas sp.]
MLNQTAEYALRTAVYLTEHRERGPVIASELATQLAIPSNYLSKILHQLAKDGLLISQRGKTGGFRLARAPERITLAEVIEGFDPVGERRRCLLGKAVCSDRSPCPAHDHWRDHSAGHARFFHETTLAMLVPTAPAMTTAVRRKG